MLNEPTGVLPALRPWDGLTQAPPPTVATPWWQRRPPRRWLTAAVGTLAVTGVAWGLRPFEARPVSSVTLVPVRRQRVTMRAGWMVFMSLMMRLRRGAVGCDHGRLGPGLSQA